MDANAGFGIKAFPSGILQWFQSNGTYIGGYWDATLEQWQGTRYQGRSGANQNITTIGITPVFLSMMRGKKAR